MLAASLSLLTACGFQLRGTDLSAIGDIHLVGAAGETGRAMTESLEAYGANIVPKAAGVTVRIEDQRSQRRPVATSASIDAAQYELRLEIDYTINQGVNVIAPLTTISSERIYSVDALNLSGSYEEQQMLLEDMRSELALQVAQRLESWLDESGH